MMETSCYAADAPEDAGVLARRCGLEYNEALFLLEAAGGDVRKATALQGSCAGWAGPGGITAATLTVLHKASPPDELPSSPSLSCSVHERAGVLALVKDHWPTMRQAAAAMQDWDLLDEASSDSDASSIDSEDEWVEIDEAGKPKQTFVQVLEKASGDGSAPPKPLPTMAVPPLSRKGGREGRKDRSGEPLFEFEPLEEGPAASTSLRSFGRGGHRDGHTRHTKKCEQTKADRRAKRASKKAARKSRATRQ